MVVCIEETGPSHVSRRTLGNKGMLPEPGLYSIRLFQSEKKQQKDTRLVKKREGNYTILSNILFSKVTV